LISVIIPDSVESIGTNAFMNCASLDTIYYGGATATEWSSIPKATGNTQLSSVTVYLYSVLQPQTAGSFWHYDTNGVTPLIWS
jgi:hypothetical protein